MEKEEDTGELHEVNDPDVVAVDAALKSLTITSSPVKKATRSLTGEPVNTLWQMQSECETLELALERCEQAIARKTKIFEDVQKQLVEQRAEEEELAKRLAESLGQMSGSFDHHQHVDIKCARIREETAEIQDTIEELNLQVRALEAAVKARSNKESVARRVSKRLSTVSYFFQG